MQNNDNDRGHGGSLIPLIFGFAIGALAMILSDEKKRSKLKDMFNTSVDKSGQVMDSAKEKLDEKQSEGRRKLAQGLEKAKKSVEP